MPGFIDKDTTTTTGKARDLQIAGDLDMWVANGGTTSVDGLTFNQAVITKMGETSGPTKGSGEFLKMLFLHEAHSVACSEHRDVE